MKHQVGRNVIFVLKYVLKKEMFKRKTSVKMHNFHSCFIQVIVVIDCFLNVVLVTLVLVC